MRVKFVATELGPVPPIPPPDQGILGGVQRSRARQAERSAPSKRIREVRILEGSLRRAYKKESLPLRSGRDEWVRWG